MTWRLGHRPALDGLRGLAVILVVYCHLAKSWGSRNEAGATGVTVFFALSGFLITTLLLTEQSGTKAVSLRCFYERRARRLLPALVAMLAVVAAYLAATGQQPTWVLVPLLYVSNWFNVAGHNPPYLGHTWSLSVEEQFYILWPLVVIACRRRPTALAGLCAVGVVVANLERAFLWDRMTGYWRVMAGSDTRADAILAGCLAAVLVQRYGLPRVGPVATGVSVALIVVVGSIEAVGSVALLVLTVVPWLSVVALLGACHGSRRLSASWLRWFGRRSYAIYLWHAPLMLFALEYQPGVMAATVGVAASLVVAELSWRYVETPWLTRRREPAPESAEVGQAAL